MTASPEPRNRRALLIGINHYPRLPESVQLEGAVNDARAMAQMLTERFGFPQGNVRLLLDEAATRDAIFAAMDWLVEETWEGDVVVFYFSGHGSQMIDREGHKPDGLDQTIVPVDSGRGPHPCRDISDDEIYSWLLGLTAKTPCVTLIFDCSHSPVFNRDVFGGKGRGVEADCRPVEELPPLPPWALRALTPDRPPKGGRGWLPWDRRWTLFAACATHQQSHELRIPGATGVRRGALTYYLVQELQKAWPGDTWRDLFERVSPQVTAEFRNQTPQLEGVWDREVFGLRHFEPLRFISVSGRHRDGRVLLEAGTVNGLREGSIWEVYSQGAREAVPGTGLGLVEITSVSAFGSKGKVVSEVRPDFIRRGSRAVERYHSHGDMGWTVDLVISSAWTEHIEILETGIQSSPLLRRVSPSEGGEAQTRVYLLGPRLGVLPGDPAPMLETIGEPLWVAIGKDGQLALPVRRAEALESAFDLLDSLEKLARYHHALALENPTSSLRGNVEVILERLADGGWVPARQDDGQAVFFEGEHLALEVVNWSGQSLYLYAVGFGLAGKVDLICPPQWIRECVSRERLVQEWPLSVPWDLPFEAPGAPASGSEFVKLFATTEPVDFSLLFQLGFNPGENLPSYIQRVAYRGSDPASAAKSQDWTTVTRSFVLCRRTRVAW